MSQNIGYSKIGLPQNESISNSLSAASSAITGYSKFGSAGENRINFFKCFGRIRIWKLFWLKVIGNILLGKNAFIQVKAQITDYALHYYYRLGGSLIEAKLFIFACIGASARTYLLRYGVSSASKVRVYFPFALKGNLKAWGYAYLRSMGTIRKKYVALFKLSSILVANKYAYFNALGHVQVAVFRVFSVVSKLASPQKFFYQVLAEVLPTGFAYFKVLGNLTNNYNFWYLKVVGKLTLLILMTSIAKRINRLDPSDFKLFNDNISDGERRFRK